LKTFVCDRAGHDRRYAIDGTKIREELGYMPRRGFRRGFAETLEWYLANERWWRPLLK
jgi:dTDP-glucose 4,6-dehydratase